MAEVLMETNLSYSLFKRGKTRDVYDLGDGTLLVVATDRVSAFDKIMYEGIPGKGQALNSLSAHWFQQTQNVFPNHFIESVDERTMRVRRAERVDIEWIVRGNIYGSLWRAYAEGKRNLYGITLPEGLKEAEELPKPILTSTTKAETGHDQPITKEEAISAGLVRDEGEWNYLANATFRLYESYRQYTKERGIIIPDFKIEFGREEESYIQIDEPPTHDSARFWAEQFYVAGQKQEGHALDKEFLRQFLIEGHNYKGEGSPPHLPPLVVDQVSKRCVGATEALTGRFELLTGKQLDLINGLMTVEQVLQELRK